MIQNYRFKLPALSIIILTIIILNFDYFVTDEFKIESGFLIGFMAVLVIYLFRLFLVSRFNRFILLIINLVILTLGAYSISILSILSFGYGFTGREVPVIWIIGFITNVGLLILVTLNLIDNFKIKKLENE